MKTSEKQLLDMQKIIIDYFEDTDDKTMISIIDSFVYGKSTKNNEASKLIESFIKDNGIETAFVNYMIDIKAKAEGNPMWLRSSYSERSIIEDIKLSLLNLSYNRFRNLVDKQVKPIECKKVKLKTDNEDTSSIHAISILDSEITICGVYTEGDYVSDVKHNVKGKITCEHCIAIIKQGKSIKL